MVDMSISFFGFPKDEQRLKIWVHCCQHQTFVPLKHSKTCSKHFTERQYSKNPARLANVPPPFWIVLWVDSDSYLNMIANFDTHVEVVLVPNTVVHVNSGNEIDHLGNRPKHPHF